MFTRNPNHYGQRWTSPPNFPKSPYSYHLSWIPGIDCFTMFWLLFMSILTPNKSQRARIESYVWPKSNRWLIDSFIQHILFVVYCREFGLLGKKIKVCSDVMIWLIFLMSHSSWCLHGQGSKAEVRKISLEAFAITKMRSDGGINQGGGGHRCLFYTFQRAWYVSVFNILFNKEVILYSCLPIPSHFPNSWPSNKYKEGLSLRIYKVVSVSTLMGRECGALCSCCVQQNHSFASYAVECISTLNSFIRFLT